MRIGTAGFILAVAAIIGGCNSSPSSPAGTTGGGAGATPDVKKGETHSGKLSKLNIIDVKTGTGPAAKDGDELSISYEGSLANGTVFDSTDKDGGKPLPVTLGAGQVIKGWDQGLVGIKNGGERKLEIPANLAYGTQEQRGIPPGSDLYFDVKCVNLTTAEQQRNQDSQETVEIVKDGSGPAVKKGSALTVDYICKKQTGETYFSTFDSKKPESFILGKGQVLPGVEQGLLGAAAQGLHQGAEVKLTVPPMNGPHGPTATPQVWSYDIWIRKVE